MKKKTIEETLKLNAAECAWLRAKLEKLSAHELWRRQLIGLYLFLTQGKEGEKAVRQKLGALAQLVKRTRALAKEYPEKLGACSSCLFDEIAVFAYLAQASEDDGLDENLVSQTVLLDVFGRAGFEAGDVESALWHLEREHYLEDRRSRLPTYRALSKARRTAEYRIRVALREEEKILSPSQQKKIRKREMHSRRTARSA